MVKCKMQNSSSEPLISIITLTYNHEKFISQCIESCLSQTYQNWEQIIIDDGSTDKTPEIIKKYKDKRIKYIYQEHRGPEYLWETYNKALSLCNGEFISILEGDDFCAQDKLEILIKGFANEDIVLTYGITQETTENGVLTKKTIPNIKKQNFSHSILFNDPLGSAVIGMLDREILTYTFPCSVLIRKKTLEKIGGFQKIEGCPLVDYPTFLHLALEGKFCFIPEVVGYWRRRKDSITQIYFETIRRKIYFFSVDFLERNLQKINITPKEKLLLEKKWAKSWSYIFLQQGRLFLINKKWADARKKFLKVIAHPGNFINFLGGIIGLLFSFFHLNIEWIARLLGKTYYSKVKNIPKRDNL